MKIEDILVPIDFSPGSLRALDYALAMVDPCGEVYLQGGIEEILFGSTADKVLRAARIPVMCAPHGANGGGTQ
jgi:nucleotide-binding universal stress UspA family protein